MNTPTFSYFYKYVTAEVAKKILSTRTVQYSSPLTFNDPFDNQHDLTFPFSPEQRTKSFRNIMLKLWKNDTPENGNIFAKLLRIIQNISPLPKDTLLDVVTRGHEQSEKKFSHMVNMLCQKLKEEAAKGKIFCVSEIPDNLLMWSHYANSHQGVVIKFLCLSDIDNVLCAAKKVTYQKSIPLLGTPEEIFEDILGLSRQPRLGEIWQRLTLTKGIDWAYEKEWRVIIPNYCPQADHHLQPIEPVEIGSIIFGCNISTKDREQIRNMLTADFAHVKSYQAEKSNSTFKININPID